MSYKYAFTKDGNIVNIENILMLNKNAGGYFIPARDSKTGEMVSEEVIPVLKTVKGARHFKRFPKKSDSSIVSLDYCEYKAIICKKLVNKLFTFGGIDYIGLPESRLKFNGQSELVLGNVNGWVGRIPNIDKVIVIDGTEIKLDLELTNPSDNNKLGIIFKLDEYQLDEPTIELIKHLDFGVIQIDLSSIIDSNMADIGELEDAITSAIATAEYTTWIHDYNSKILMSRISNIVKISEISTSKFSDDGNWKFYKDDVANKIPNCPYIINWDGLSYSGSRDRYIVEKQCLSCPRYAGYYKTCSGIPVFLCDQSIGDVKNNIGEVLKYLI